MRRLVVSFHVTVANYEYLVYWRFYQDGNIECEVRATGIMVVTHIDGGQAPPTARWSTTAPTRRSTSTSSWPAWTSTSTAPRTRSYMLRDADLPIVRREPARPRARAANRPAHRGRGPRRLRLVNTQRAWKVVNENKRNTIGNQVAYKLVPGAAIPPMFDPASPVLARAQVIGHTLWVTPYDPRRALAVRRVREPERRSTTACPSGSRRSAPFATPTSCSGTCSASTTSPAQEDWPIMPGDTVSFWLKPVGFFDRNPSIDVAP